MKLTRISYGNDARACEIAIPKVSSFCLIIIIHGYRSMKKEILRRITCTAIRYSCTIDFRTCKINNLLKFFFLRSWFRHTPLPMMTLRALNDKTHTHMRLMFCFVFNFWVIVNMYLCVDSRESSFY